MKNKNPPIWLYHRTSKNNAKKIATEGIVPKGCKFGIGMKPYCESLDGILPFRKQSVYFGTKDFHIPDCDEEWGDHDEWFAIRADKIPCRCKEIDHRMTNTLYNWVDLKDSEIRNEVLKEMGYERHPKEEDMTIDEKRRFNSRYWGLVTKKNDEFIDNLKKGKGVKLSRKLGYDAWISTFKDFDKGNKSLVEIMCPCIIPTDHLKMPCENYKGKRNYD